MAYLPISMRKIFYNEVTNVDIEMKLFKYAPSIQDIEMRESFCVKPISKIYLPKPAKEKITE